MLLQDLDVAGVHFHWTGSFVFPNDHLVVAIHHQTTSCMDPVVFSQKTINALLLALKVIQERAC
jgi:hypothetical protein